MTVNFDSQNFGRDVLDLHDQMLKLGHCDLSITVARVAEIRSPKDEKTKIKRRRSEKHKEPLQV